MWRAVRGSQPKKDAGTPRTPEVHTEEGSCLADDFDAASERRDQGWMQGVNSHRSKGGLVVGGAISLSPICLPHRSKAVIIRSNLVPLWAGRAPLAWANVFLDR